jgi:shikimate 5-dehydrogenase
MESKRLNITNVTGMVMTFYQAFEQYKIYTGLDAPKKNMLDAYSSKYLKKVNI